MSSALGGQVKRVSDFRSPLRSLVWSFRKSRDQWKQKCQDAKRELKRFKVRVADVSKSREAWRERSEARQRELEALQAQVQQLQDQLLEVTASAGDQKMRLPAEVDWSLCPRIAR